MVPAVSLRQTPVPLHISMARAKPPSALKSRYVLAPARETRPVAQILGHRRGIDVLPGFIRPSGSQMRLNSRIALIELRAEDQLVQLGPLQAVAVLARHDAAEAVRQARGDNRHVRHGLNALDRLEVDQGADVEAAGRGVRVVGGRRSVRGHELFDGPDVLGQVLDGDGDVLDDRDRLVVTAYAHQESQTGLADRPDVLLSRRIEHDQRIGGGAYAVGEEVRLRRSAFCATSVSLSP